MSTKAPTKCQTHYQQTVKADECALITEMVARRVAYPLAVLAYRLNLTPNQVTIFSGCCWVFSTPLAVLADFAMQNNQTLGWGLWFVCGFLWNAGYLLDLVDGSLARLKGVACPSGFYMDYVFHLLFKPSFLASVGIGVYLSNSTVDGLWLAGLLPLAILSIPANWSASSSAVEHVLCEETGKGRLALSGDASRVRDADARKLWLGATDSNDSATAKATGFLQRVRIVLQEVLSFYGQFSFFSVLILFDLGIDVMCPTCPIQLPVTMFFFVCLSLLMIVRTPFRVARDFKRIRNLDKQK